MSHEHTANEGTEDNGNGQNGRHRFRGPNDPMGWAKRPGFNPMKALAVVAGFAIFPPLGIGALAWFVWNERRWRRGEGGFAANDGEGPAMCGRGRNGRGWRTGNAAFDDYSAQVMDELAEKRRAFHEFRAEERRKRDQATFDAFQANRAGKAE